MSSGEPLVAAIRQVWSEVLGVPLDGDPHFFEQGGDSLQAMHVVARVRAATGVEVRVRTLFRNPRLSQFAGAVARGGDGEEEPAPSEVAPARAVLHEVIANELDDAPAGAREA